MKENLKYAEKAGVDFDGVETYLIEILDNGKRLSASEVRKELEDRKIEFDMRFFQRYFELKGLITRSTQRYLTDPVIKYCLTQERFSGVIPDKIDKDDALKSLISKYIRIFGPVSVEDIVEVANEFRLDNNYPNPFNPTTQISYSIPQSGYISLKVYNLLGEEIKTLFEGVQHTGNYITWFDGTELASGVYLYQLRAKNFVETKKFMLLK